MSVSVLIESLLPTGATRAPAATASFDRRPWHVPAAPLASAMLVRRVSEPAEMEQIYRLRYRAYVEGMRRTACELGPGRATIVDSLDDGQAIHLGAFAGPELRAVLRLNLATRSDLGEYAHRYAITSRAWGIPVPDECMAIGSRFALQPGHESPALALKMALAAHWECLRNDVLRIFVHVDEHLVGFHQSLGFRKPDVTIPDVEGGTVMSLDPFDRPALRAAGSPLVAQLDGWREHSPIAVTRHSFG